MTAWIADERGHSFWSWFLIGLITGPMGFIIVLFFPRVVDDEIEKQAELYSCDIRKE